MKVDLSELYAITNKPYCNQDFDISVKCEECPTGILTVSEDAAVMSSEDFSDAGTYIFDVEVTSAEYPSLEAKTSF